MGSVHVEVRFQAQARHDSNGPGLLGCCHLANDLERPTDNAQSPEQGGGCRCLPKLQRYLVSTRSTHAWSAPPPWFMVVPFWFACPASAPSSSVASAGAWRAASPCVAFGRAWRNGSYTFYEKVVKVKADVAAILHSFLPSDHVRSGPTS